jgi:hypothetical protein
MAKQIKEVFNLNEPAVKLKNGDKRPSVTVSAKDFPMRAQRDRINSLLMMHDTHTPARDKMSANDVALLQQIAYEGTISNNIPALRYNAVLQLANFASVDTINTISHIANYGEDQYLRGSALLALGRTGLEVAIPTLATAMADENVLISNAATKGMLAVVRTLGMDRVDKYFTANKGLDYSQLKKVKAALNRKAPTKKIQTKAE